MYSAEANELLARLYARDESESERIRMARWNARPRREKMLESLCRLLSPIL